MTHASSTKEVPGHGDMPRHVAIIMDGNGRWAKRRHLPRFAGHKRGVEAVREIVKACAERGVGYLTLFAFSSENWRQPPDEVALLMQLFIGALENEVQKLHRNGIRLKLIGDQSRFDPDPLTQGTHWRASPNLTWYPTEFSKFRLQFNHDYMQGFGSDESIWVQMEFLLGAHAAHQF